MSTLLLLLSIALVAALSAPIKESSAVAMTTRNVLRVEKVGDSTLCSYCVSFMNQALSILVQIIANSGCVSPNERRQKKKKTFFCGLTARQRGRDVCHRVLAAAEPV